MYKTKKVSDVSMRGIVFVAVLCMLFVIGCASSGKTPKNFSGYLHDYSQLKPDPDYKGVLVWMLPDKDLKKFRRFIVDPVTVYLPPEVRKGEGSVDPAVINKITDYLHKAFVQALEPEYPVVEDSGHDVARLQIAITGVELNRKDLKAYQYVPAALVVTGAAEATGMRNRVAVMMMEAEMANSLTGQRVAAIVQQAAEEVRVGTPKDLKERDVFPVLDYWAKQLRERIDNVHGVK
jgi:hypothetical protein